MRSDRNEVAEGHYAINDIMMSHDPTFCFFSVLLKVGENFGGNAAGTYWEDSEWKLGLSRNSGLSSAAVGVEGVQ